MGVVSSYWLEKSLEKLQEFDRKISDPGLASYLEALQNYDHVEGEIVELESDDETYRITGRKPLLTSLRKEKVYKGERMFENPDGELTSSYVSDTFTEDEIE